MIPVSMILFGLSIKYFIGRRRFNRRNVAGLQQFTSFEKAVAITFLERMLNLFASGLIVFGVIAALV